MLLAPALPHDRETARLDALRRYHLDGPSPEVAFDHVARLAADLFEVPAALVSFVGAQEQFTEGGVDFGLAPMARDLSFCAHTIAGDDVLVVEDARVDPRFRDNPFVLGEPFVRFYAGAPVVTPDGHRLGSICLIDRVPRPPLTERQRGLLRSLARIVMDGLEHRRLDTVRRASAMMAAAIPDAFFCVDEAGLVTFWNPAAERMFGHARDEMVGRPFADLVPPDLQPHFRDLMARRLAAVDDPGIAQPIEMPCRRRDGSRIPLEVSLATWRSGGHVVTGFVARDLSERESTRARVRHLTHCDALTGLPNRALFLERVDFTLKTVERFAVLKVGLDGFKSVNGSIGMAAGDSVLVAAAARVRDEAGPAALVARLGGDEFGVLLAGAEAMAAEALADRLVARLGEPFEIGAAICHLGASVGVMKRSGGSPTTEASDVLKGAMLALQQAKLAGGRRAAPFQPRLGRQAEERRRLAEELRRALTRHEFELHFQPQVDLADGRVFGAEALLRWWHPERGLLSPAAFLAVLETSAMALPVGRWVLGGACRFAARMAAEGLPLRIGVNLFAAQLRDAGLVADVDEALEASGLAAASLELEITETTVLGLDESTIAPLRRLRARGVGIAFDDYGTGFASLSLLKRYPLTRLKIDRGFVRDLRSDPEDAAIVKAVIALGDSLGLAVIAEGLESRDQAVALLGLGCREAQGYLFGRPMSADAFAGRFAGVRKRGAA